ncbi:MAG TPA: A/G-specific adenine glycosylase [Candidatus Limnocylindrales bacterium]|nr:A/G-specific adenine glycosylase [Candidatus Limnocylindrales bacterium]
MSSPAVPPFPPEARAAVLAWYDDRGRALAFRATRDPYAILVSEVMAQQTQISRVVEAWGRFLERFPTVAALAAATPADVLRAWQGMGYDRRALHLRRAAQAIVTEHGGQVPRDLAALERLPGVGPYTARAVASIAYGERVGAVDTNVRRVLGRVVAGGAATAVTRRELQALADDAVDPDRPGDWTHAVMDVGATVCRPRAPRCEACPLVAWCRFADERPTAEAASEASAPPPTERATRPAPAPFPATTRWLRGRIVDRLRAATGAEWTSIEVPIGEHDAAAIGRSLAALARDGVVELDPVDELRARLATG